MAENSVTVRLVNEKIHNTKIKALQKKGKCAIIYLVND